TTYLHFLPSFLYFFLTTTATTDIYPLSLHDALPILLHGQLSIPDHGARTASPRRSAQRLLGTQLERRRVHRRPAQGSLGQRLRLCQPGSASERFRSLYARRRRAGRRRRAERGHRQLEHERLTTAIAAATRKRPQEAPGDVQATLERLFQAWESLLRIHTDRVARRRRDHRRRRVSGHVVHQPARTGSRDGGRIATLLGFAAASPRGGGAPGHRYRRIRCQLRV